MVKKQRLGVVVKNAMDKTVVVRVERKFSHSLYGKVIRRSSKFYAHDEKNVCGIGDTVRIFETRPLSKLKRWMVVEVVKKKELIT